MEEHYIKDVGKITYVHGVNLEEHKTVIEKQQKRIVELEQELAELKEKAIIPRFEYGDKVYYIKYFVGKWQVFNQEYVGENISNIIVRTMNYYSELSKDSVFATEQDAQEKLKELKGEKDDN